MNLPGILSPASLAGLVALVGVAVYDGLAPRAPQEASKQTLEMQLKRRQRDVAETRAKLATFDRETQATVWTKKPEELGPYAMRTVGDFAADHGVRLTAMRPQKAEKAGEAQQMNFLATVEGPFTGLAAFLGEFEQRSTILSVRSVQVGLKDSSGKEVRANVGIVAYAPGVPGG